MRSSTCRCVLSWRTMPWPIFLVASSKRASPATLGLDYPMSEGPRTGYEQKRHTMTDNLWLYEQDTSTHSLRTHATPSGGHTWLHVTTLRVHHCAASQWAWGASQLVPMPACWQHASLQPTKKTFAPGHPANGNKACHTSVALPLRCSALVSYRQC